VAALLRAAEETVMPPTTTFAIDLNGPGHYIHLVGPIQISLGNLIVIILMLIVFALAVLVPFPKDKK
jgi:hypothetical protein